MKGASDILDLLGVVMVKDVPAFCDLELFKGLAHLFLNSGSQELYHLLLFETGRLFVTIPV